MLESVVWGILACMFLLIVVYNSLKVFYSVYTTNNLPPCPPGWIPVIGHMWMLDAEKPFQTMDKLSKQMGDIFSFYFGSDRVVVISRLRLLKEAFLKQGSNFCGRPELFVHRWCWGEGHVISEGAQSVEMRAFLMTAMREGGGVHSVKQALKERLKLEVIKMVKFINGKLDKYGTADLNMEETVFYTVGNMLSWLVLGRTYPHGSLEFWKNSEWMQRTMELMHKASALTFLPWLRFCPPSGFSYWAMKKQAKAVHKMMITEIRKRIANQEYKDPSKVDVTSLFLRKIDEIKRKGKTATEVELICYTKEKLARIMTELFFAGIQTEVNTFGWAILYFISYPEIQDMCRRDILKLTSNGNRQISYDDRLKLPYLEATIHEIQRHCCIAPFAVLHKTREDTTLDDYFIPKSSTIMMNLWSTMRDPTQFSDADEFRPSRFLDDEGGVVKSRVESVLPYGIGRRVCMGEGLARIELFQIIAALLQNYRFTKIPGHHYSLDHKMQLTIHPDPYLVRVEKISK